MIELVTTSGIFALDGGRWEVTNNIWLVGNDREVIAIDAARDAAPIVAAVRTSSIVWATDASAALSPSALRTGSKGDRVLS